MTGNLVGRTYYERGEPVEILCQWRTKTTTQVLPLPTTSEGWAINLTWWSDRAERGAPSHGPRNVLIRRSNGDHVIRPFRGLRKDPPR